MGGRLAQSLAADNQVYVSSRNSPPNNVRSIYHPSVIFVTHESVLDGERFPNNIDQVIHLAALNERDSTNDSVTAAGVNTEGTRRVLQVAVAKKVKRFIYFSTVQVYGRRPDNPEVTERTALNPGNVYASTHKNAEDHVLGAHRTGTIEGVVVRMSNSFGAPIVRSANCWNLLVNDVCRQAATARVIRLNSNGCQYRDFVTLTEVERVIHFLIEMKMPISKNIFNLSSGKSMKVIDMANLISNQCGRTLGVKVPVLLPENSSPSEEQNITIHSEELTNAGFSVECNYEAEVGSLLEFCQRNFQTK